MLIFFTISCTKKQETEVSVPVRAMDLSGYSALKPDKPLELLFIHHSCGGQLLAEKGNLSGESSIYQSHPNGGGLRKLLERNNYIVHEASYGSKIGEDTDICHWNAKFRDMMEMILKCKGQDELFTDGTRNKIVMFKSCFPNNWIVAEGKGLGDPDSCERSIANYKAAYTSLLPFFQNNPNTLYVAFTAPPIAKPNDLKEYVKRLLGRSSGNASEIGSRARAFNNWIE